MPSTASMVDRIQRAVSNYSRPQIIDAMNEVLKIVYSQPAAQMQAIDPTTGQPPFLATTAGQYTYDLPDDCRECVAAVIDTGVLASGSTTTHYGLPVFSDAKTLIAFNRLWRVIPATSIAATYDEPATITFTDDPGTTTDNINIVYFKKAPEIETQDDPVPLPENLHYLMRQATLAMLSTENYGETGFNNQVLENTVVKIRTEMNRGTQARVGKTPVQVQDMNFTTQGYMAGYRRRY